MIAIRIRSDINLSPKARKTLELLNLRAVNNASVWNNEKEKMIRKVSPYITYGELNEKTLELLIESRGEPIKNEKVDVKKALSLYKEGKSIKESGLKNKFRLNSPKKGWERKGVKKPKTIGGVSGYRKEGMNEIVMKML